MHILTNSFNTEKFSKHDILGYTRYKFTKIEVNLALIYNVHFKVIVTVKDQITVI